jgi:hypothetical protein
MCGQSWFNEKQSFKLGVSAWSAMIGMLAVAQVPGLDSGHFVGGNQGLLV